MAVESVNVTDDSAFALVADFGADPAPPKGVTVINAGDATSAVTVVVEGVHWDNPGGVDVPPGDTVGMPVAVGGERVFTRIPPGDIRRVYAKGSGGVVSVIEDIK